MQRVHIEKKQEDNSKKAEGTLQSLDLLAIKQENCILHLQVACEAYQVADTHKKMSLVERILDLVKTLPLVFESHLPNPFDKAIERCHKFLQRHTLPLAQQKAIQKVIDTLLEAEQDQLRKNDYVENLNNACLLYQTEPDNALGIIASLMQNSPFAIGSQAIALENKISYCLAHLNLKDLSADHKKVFDAVMKILLTQDSFEKTLYRKKLTAACKSYRLSVNENDKRKIISELCLLLLDSPFGKIRSIPISSKESLEDTAIKYCDEHLKFLHPSSLYSLAFKEAKKVLIADIKNEKERRYIQELQEACSTYYSSDDPALKSKAIDALYHLIQHSPFLDARSPVAKKISVEQGKKCCQAHLTLSLSPIQKEALNRAEKIFDEARIMAQPYKPYLIFMAYKQQKSKGVRINKDKNTKDESIVRPHSPSSRAS